MNKQELIDFVAKDAGFSKVQAKQAVNSVVKGILSALKKKTRLMVLGLGTFLCKKRKARTARNPRTGEPMQIPAKWVVSFKAGQTLKDLVNEK
jgi:DNA-binding protein HU-beta